MLKPKIRRVPMSPPRSISRSRWPEVVGLIPAAGLAERLQPAPCSKELFPVGFQRDPADGMPRAKVATEYLLDKFRAAGITKTYMVIRDGKWDIPHYFQEGLKNGLSVAYVVIPGSLGPPDTIDRAYAFVAPYRIAFGFPDMLFEPPEAFTRLIQRQEQTEADIVLGLHRIDEPHLWDMVQTDRDGRVRKIVMKPGKTTLTLGWHVAVWTPVFTEFLHRFLRRRDTRRHLSQLTSTKHDPGGDLAVGIVLQAAIKEGLTVQSQIFPRAQCLDVGTPQRLFEAVRRFHTE